jgi:LEA14-like dessication related protein
MRKMLYVIAAILAIPLILFIILLVQYWLDPDPKKSLTDPRIEFADLTLEELSEDSVHVTGKFLIYNRLPWPFLADSLEHSLSINGEEIITNTDRTSMRVPPWGEAVVELPMVVKLNNLRKIEQDQKGKNDSVEYRIVSTFYSHFPYSKHRKYERVKYLPLFHLLETEIKKVRIDKLRKDGARLEFLLEFYNENKFPIRVEDIHYKFFVDGKYLAEGKSEESLEFPPEARKSKEFILHLTFKNLSETVWKLIKDGNDTPYIFRLNFVIRKEQGRAEGKPVEIEAHGPVSDLKLLRDKN